MTSEKISNLEVKAVSYLEKMVFKNNLFLSKT